MFKHHRYPCSTGAFTAQAEGLDVSSLPEGLVDTRFDENDEGLAYFEESDMSKTVTLVFRDEGATGEHELLLKAYDYPVYEGVHVVENTLTFNADANETNIGSIEIGSQEGFGCETSPGDITYFLPCTVIHVQ